MRYKREKEKDMNKGRIAIIIAILVIVVICGIVLIKTKNKEVRDNNENNSLSSTNKVYDNDNDNEETLEPMIMAYIKESNVNKKLVEGEILNNNISVYCIKGKIVEITHNGNTYEGTDLNEEGQYVITMKPDNQSENISRTITINKIKPAIIINGNNIAVGETYNINSIITIKEKKGIDRIAKALLIKCNTNYEQDNSTEPVDITIDLKNEGYAIDKRGIYKIQILDENNNKVEFIGNDVGFKVK